MAFFSRSKIECPRHPKFFNALFVSLELTIIQVHKQKDQGPYTEFKLTHPTCTPDRLVAKCCHLLNHHEKQAAGGGCQRGLGTTLTAHFTLGLVQQATKSSIVGSPIKIGKDRVLSVHKEVFSHDTRSP